MMTETAKRYGSSLYELAVEENMAKEVLDELGVVLNVFKENPDYIKLLSEESISKKERIKLLDDAFSKDMWPYLLTF